MRKAIVLAATLFATLASAAVPLGARGPFLSQINNVTWLIGNEVWNMTQGRQYGVKLHYKNHDCVGNAVGHYVSYNGARSDLNWTSASIAGEGYHDGRKYVDVVFIADEGEMHWVIFSQLAGAYQYFVNRKLPVLGEFRTLWRLDNTTFTHGRTATKDDALPALGEYLPENKVQDETWAKPGSDGYITKYDFTSWVRTQDYYGVYGDEAGFGSWYINPGKDYYNGDHLKQELMVHRESATGDAVQLNMIHGTHFQVSATDAFPDGKIWGPWLWYLNDGSRPDAAERAKSEFAAWPYAWFGNDAYQSRGSVSGRLLLSDGRPAAHAAVFLGDSHPTKTSLDMGSDYYYTGYADSDGNFSFEHVRAGCGVAYGLQAWSNGSSIADVTTSLLHNDVVVAGGRTTNLGALRWPVSTRTKLFQVGAFDRTSLGFRYGGSPHQHGLAASCPPDLTYTVGQSATDEWCFAQSARGNWTIVFDVGEHVPDQRNGTVPTTPTPTTPTTTPTTTTTPTPTPPETVATLIVSLASYSTGVSSDIWANGVRVGNLTSGTPGLLNDPGLYRSATTAGEWRYFEFPFSASLLRPGRNEIVFQVTRNSSLHGFMWDSVVLEW